MLYVLELTTLSQDELRLNPDRVHMTRQAAPNAVVEAVDVHHDDRHAVAQFYAFIKPRRFMEESQQDVVSARLSSQ